MSQIPMDRVPAAKLAEMLDSEHPGAWPGEEAGAILRHQLGAPLLADLSAVPGAETMRLRELIAGQGGADTFLAQLTSSRASVELLTAIKQFARHHRDDPASPLKGAPATHLYYAAIAAAMVFCEARITQLSDEQLREGFEWSLKDPAAKPLASAVSLAMQKLATGK
jgi:hypothetical protein